MVKKKSPQNFKLRSSMGNGSVSKKVKRKTDTSCVDLSTMSVDDFLNSAEFSSDGSDLEVNDTPQSKATHSKQVSRKKKKIRCEQNLPKTAQLSHKNREEQDESGATVDDSQVVDSDDTDSEELHDASNEEEQDSDEDGEGLVHAEDEELSDEDAEESDAEEVDENEGIRHKKELAQLQDTDPEFYKFLKENDKNLLDFEVSDDDGSQSDTGEPETGEDTKHQPPEALEVASDDSDYEQDQDTGDSRSVSLQMIKTWQEQLQSDKTAATLQSVVKAFRAALRSVSSDEDGAEIDLKVEGSSVFNAVVQLCVFELQPALKRILGVKETVTRFDPVKCKRWIKVKISVKHYLADLLKLLGSVASAQIITVLLKHLHQLTPFVTALPNVIRPLFRRLVQLWATGEDTVRVLAFLCILRITTSSREQQLLPSVLKSMYMAYVKHSKFVSPNTLPGINFMRRSLAELYAVDDGVAYTQVFLYIRQLAIHLRNAVTLHKKDHIQAVYNWQFINSLRLWTTLLANCSHGQLRPLLYPLVQVISGTIRLVPTTQYFPLRFHCVQMLIELARGADIFIPVMPFLLEVLMTFDFNKRHKKLTIKAQDFTCILRAPKLQQQENGFKDAIIEKIYQLLLEYLVSEAHTVGFPDLVVPAVLQLKKFLKICKNANYTKKIRQLADKIQENSHFVEAERRKASFALSDRKAISAWETNVKLKGTPLIMFYDSWVKVHQRQMAKQATGNDKLADFNLPVLKKRTKPEPDDEMESGPVVLFPSDDESDDGVGFKDETNTPAKKKRKYSKSGVQSHKQKQSIIVNDNVIDKGDIVEDLKLSDI